MPVAAASMAEQPSRHSRELTQMINDNNTVLVSGCGKLKNCKAEVDKDDEMPARRHDLEYEIMQLQGAALKKSKCDLNGTFLQRQAMLWSYDADMPVLYVNKLTEFVDPSAHILWTRNGKRKSGNNKATALPVPAPKKSKKKSDDRNAKSVTGEHQTGKTGAILEPAPRTAVMSDKKAPTTGPITILPISNEEDLLAYVELKKQRMEIPELKRRLKFAAAEAGLNFADLVRGLVD